MDSSNRSTLLWTLVAATAAYAIVTVVIFYTTGRFSGVWFAASLVVYGALALVALFLAFADARKERPEVALARAAPEPKAARKEPLTYGEQVVYRAGSGSLVRTTVGGNGEDHADFYLLTPQERLPLRDAEARLDTLEERPIAGDLEEQVDEAVERRYGNAARRKAERRRKRETEVTSP